MRVRVRVRLVNLKPPRYIEIQHTNEEPDWLTRHSPNSDDLFFVRVRHVAENKMAISSFYDSRKIASTVEIPQVLRRAWTIRLNFIIKATPWYDLPAKLVRPRVKLLLRFIAG